MDKALENYLHENIPISKALGIRVKEAAPEKVVLAAPFNENINHKKTVFGGSLHAVATLACWSLIYLNLKNSHEIVIAKSQIKYIKPVITDFEATCTFPKEWQRFKNMLDRKGKSRIGLDATILQGIDTAVDFSGIFVALK